MPKALENATVGALLKGFAIIEHLSEGAMPLGEVARRMGLPKSSAHRLLTTLVELGVAEQCANDYYRLTARLFAYGVKALNAMDLISTAHPYMNEVRDSTGETVHLAVRSGRRAVYVQKVNSVHSLRMDSSIGYQAPLYCTSLGKCLLAWLEPREAAALADEMTFQPVMPNTITNKVQLLAHLGEVRRQGYSCDNEENEANVICFGAPIFDHGGQIMAAISVSLPMLRYNEVEKEKYVRAVQNAARKISAQFGCPVWPPRSEMPEVHQKQLSGLQIKRSEAC